MIPSDARRHRSQGSSGSLPQSIPRGSGWPHAAAAARGTVLCPNWGKKKGCRRASKCSMLHVNYNAGETVMSGIFQHRGEWCVPADAVRQYLDTLFTLPPEVVVRALLTGPEYACR